VPKQSAKNPTEQRPSKFFPPRKYKMDNMKDALEKATHRPRVGVTQGGSSKRWHGAKPAATKVPRKRMARNG